MPAENETVAPSELVHTVIRARELEPMVDWYVQALGCEVAERSESLALLRFDHRLLRILLVADKTLERGAGDQGYDHFAFEYRTMDELVVRTYARLAESGVKPYWCTNHGMTTSIYYADPDGNKVEMQVDNFPTKAEGLAYIRGPDFARNPVGIDFDPTRWSPRYAAARPTKRCTVVSKATHDPDAASRRGRALLRSLRPSPPRTRVRHNRPKSRMGRGSI